MQILLMYSLVQISILTFFDLNLFSYKLNFTQFHLKFFPRFAYNFKVVIRLLFCCVVVVVVFVFVIIIDV